jgi:short-subunit dehydrogenase
MIYEDLKGKKVLVTGASSGIGLASEAASFITGEYIAVNGGLLMRA